jgi:hypothetical protein
MAMRAEGSKKVSPIVKPYFISLSEQSVRDRHRCVKNAMTLRSLYTMYAMTKSALRLRETSRKGYHGSNFGDTIGPVSLENLSRSWTMAFGAKTKMYGPFRVAVGGPTAESDDGEDDNEILGGDDMDQDQEDDGKSVPTKVSDNDLVPVFYNSLPIAFYDDLIHSLGLVAVLDLTAGPGCFAMAAIKAGIPYCGVCFTEEHVRQLYSRLTSLVAACVQDEGSSLFQSAVCQEGGWGRRRQPGRRGWGMSMTTRRLRRSKTTTRAHAAGGMVPAGGAVVGAGRGRSLSQSPSPGRGSRPLRVMRSRGALTESSTTSRGRTKRTCKRRRTPRMGLLPGATTTLIVCDLSGHCQYSRCHASGAFWWQW